MESKLGFEVTLDLTYQDSLEQVAQALKTEGFGVLTRIDVQATLQEKLGISFRPYTILGACNPHLASRALSADPEVGLVLPCNVTVEEVGDRKTLVRIVNPEGMMQVGSLGQNSDIRAVAEEARQRLERVVNSLVSG